MEDDRKELRVAAWEAYLLAVTPDSSISEILDHLQSAYWLALDLEGIDEEDDYVKFQNSEPYYQF